MTKFLSAPIVAAIFAIAGIFGFNFSPDIQDAVSSNLDYVINGILALVAVIATIKSKAKPDEPDEHTQVDRQRGSARVEGLVLIGLIAVFAAFSFGCATVQEMTPNQKVAAALVTTTSIRSTCADLYERDRISITDAYACLDYADQARSLIDQAYIALGKADERGAATYLEAAIQLLTAMEKALAAVPDRPISSQASNPPSNQPVGVHG